MQFFAAPWRNKSRQHALCVVVLGTGFDQANSTKNSMGMGIDRKNVEAEAVHHYAKRRLRPYAGQTSQIGVGFFRRETPKLAGRSGAEIGQEF